MYHQNKRRMLLGATPYLIGATKEALETKDADVLDLVKQVSNTVKDLSKDFESFKDAHRDEVKQLKKGGSVDFITEDKVKKIDDSLNNLTEAKTALERLIETEKKEREALELRLQKLGKGAGDDKAEKELKNFNLLLQQNVKSRSGSLGEFTLLDLTGYDSYKSAFNAFMRKQNLTQDEAKVLSVGSDPDGGFFVTPDVSGRIITKVFETSEMRQVASIQVIGTDALEGIEDRAEAGAGYAGERTQGSDATTPTVGKWKIPVFIIDTEPKTTQQLLDDAMVDVEAWLSGKVADKFARFENAEFVAGATNIRGFTSYDTAADDGSGVTWGKLGYVATGTSGDFGATVATQADKLHDLVGTLKNAYLTGARWATRRSVITKIRKFKIAASTDAYAWQPGLQLGQPEQILGYPVSRMEDMPALGANSLSLAFGNFQAGYQIVDRQGIRVLRDNLTSKPYVKFYTTKRVGGGVLDFEAIKLLKFGTS
jgi:HK97 family phage major capsid protein